MAQKKTEDDISKRNFEDAIKQLRTIVDKIEQGQIPLQDSLEQYEQGMALIQHCRRILQTAEKRIEKISKTDDEPAVATPEPAVATPEPAVATPEPADETPPSDEEALF